jgi:photosystem II stability/assembly factor-like uncharacterized protein
MLTAAVRRTAPPPYVTLAYVHRGVEMVGVTSATDTNQDSVPPRLYRSTPSGRWRDVTPPQSGHIAADAYPIFESASFLNASSGWVTGFNINNLKLTIYRTSDGGRSWSSIPGGVQAGSQSTTQIQLLTPRVAYRAIVEPTGPGFALAVTTDAGRSWRTVYRGPNPPGPAYRHGPFELPTVFSGRRDGFSGAGLAALTEDWPLAAPGAVRLYRTTDGGRTWSTQRPPLAHRDLSCPVGRPLGGTRSCVYGLPALFGPHEVVLPTVAETRGRAVIGFDVSRNGGATWTQRGQRETTVRPQPHQVGGGLFRYPLVAEASGRSWWVLGGTSPLVTTSVTTNGGRRWIRHRSTLPGHLSALQPISATRAWVSVFIAGTVRIYTTTNAGSTWRPLILPT